MESGETAAPSDMAESVNKLEIIRIASYHRRDFDLAVVRTDPRNHEKVRSFEPSLLLLQQSEIFSLYRLKTFMRCALYLMFGLCSIFVMLIAMPNKLSEKPVATKQ